MDQHILSEGKLLDSYGNLSEAGYAKSLVKKYNRDDIKAGKLRIKEWDYYYIGNDEFGVALTIADNSYMGLASVSLLDFVNKKFITKSVMTFMPKGETNFPNTSAKGSIFFKSKKLTISFENDGINRVLKANFKKYNDGLDFTCEIELLDEPSESMVIATPFEKKKHFYYNQKINCMRARGKATLGGRRFTFFPESSFAVLDWGRGVWTYKNTWYWSSMSGVVDGVKIGFNLGYGFGENSKATENMIFYDNKVYKIDTVTFHIKKDKGRDDFMSPWKISSNDGSIELMFEPVLDRKDHTNVIIIKSIQDQLFGRFSGILRFDNKEIKINKMMGFAEKVINKW